MQANGRAGRQQAEHPILRGRRSADAVVIGGGLTGVTTALWLCKAGLRVALVEAETLGSGATARCAGLASAVGKPVFARLERTRGAAVAAAYASTQLAALRAVRDLACEQGGASGWQDIDVQITATNEREEAQLVGEFEAMQRAGVPAALTRSSQCPFTLVQAIECKDMGVLHVREHLQSMAEQAAKLGLKIFEHSRVTALETNIVYTQRGSVLAPYIVVATGYPIVNTPGWYFLKLRQRQNWLMPLSGNIKCEGAYLDFAGRYTLYTERENAVFQLMGGDVGENFDPRAVFARRYAPWLEGVETREILSGSEVYGGDGLAFIGPYSARTPNLFVATGYDGRGIVGSMVAAQAISARVLGLSNADYEIYGRERGMDTRTALSIAGSYAMSFLKHPTAPYCPHMGCKLVYNAAQRLWECPCHGARFDDIGHVLSAPAVNDAQIRHKRRV